jgi:hypothetical protein
MMTFPKTSIDVFDSTQYSIQYSTKSSIKYKWELNVLGWPLASLTSQDYESLVQSRFKEYNKLQPPMIA